MANYASHTMVFLGRKEELAPIIQDKGEHNAEFIEDDYMVYEFSTRHAPDTDIVREIAEKYEIPVMCFFDLENDPMEGVVVYDKVRKPWKFERIFEYYTNGDHRMENAEIEKEDDSVEKFNLFPIPDKFKHIYAKYIAKCLERFEARMKEEESKPRIEYTPTVVSEDDCPW